MVASAPLSPLAKAAGTVSPRSRAGKTAVRFWKCGSANEEVQRFAIEAGKFLKLNHIHPAFAAFAFRDERLRTTQTAGNIHLGQARLSAGVP